MLSQLNSSRSSKVGIAGLDENRRIEQAQAGLGIAGEVKGKVLAGAQFGIGGLNDRHIIGADQNAALGPSGLSENIVASDTVREVEVAAFKHYDEALSSISRNSARLGDRAAREAWRKGVWFADFTYVASPFAGDGQNITWRKGREYVFGRHYRTLPFFIDSCGYRREITGTAPRWAHNFNQYVAAIELLDPDGYAAWDYPQDRTETMAYLHRLRSIFPDDSTDGRMWPVFSIRWSWCDHVHLDYSRLPGWAGQSMASLIPLTRTQRKFKEETRERWARQAIANALKLAVDQDFLWMVEKFGQVMIGGMVGGPCPRMARHLFAATLCHLFPGVKFWLLGQANFAVINGLGRMGLLDRVWSDGTWYIKDAAAFSTTESRL